MGGDRRGYVFAFTTLVVLSGVVGFVFAGTGMEQAPPSEARDLAAAQAAVRIALGGGVEAVAEAPPLALSEPQPLIAGADHVGSPDGATHIRVPAAEIDAEVRSVGYTFEGGQLRYDTPNHEAGHYAGSASPGEPGNTVIAGHVATRSGAAVFERLPEVDVGDVVEVERGDEVYRYRVTELRRVAPDDVSVMRPTADATLTLITCFPDENYADRLVVIGKLL